MSVELNIKDPLTRLAELERFVLPMAEAMDLQFHFDQAGVLAPEQADEDRPAAKASGIHRDVTGQHREYHSGDILPEGGVRLGVIVQDLGVNADLLRVNAEKTGTAREIDATGSGTAGVKSDGGLPDGGIGRS